MKTMCPLGYYHNSFVAIHALGHMMTVHNRTSCTQPCTVHHAQPYITVHHVLKCMSCHKAILVITVKAHCFHDCIYKSKYITVNSYGFVA